MNPTITQTLPVISLVVVGFLLKKIKVVKAEDGSLFSRMILNITLPAVIFLSISQVQIDPLKLGTLALCGFLISLVLRMISGGITKLLKIEDSIAGVIILGSMVMNIGTFLFPVVQTVYGVEGVSRAAAFDIGNSIMASGYGYYIATRFGTRNIHGVRDSIKNVLSVPILWAVIVGLIINLTGVIVPTFIIKMLTPLSAANTPLAMIALGLFVNFEFPKWKLILLTVFLRMGLGFLLGQAIIFLTQMQGLDRAIVTMGAAMPMGMVPLVYASTEGLDTKFAAACISLSIIIGIIVTPFLLSL